MSEYLSLKLPGFCDAVGSLDGSGFGSNVTFGFCRGAADSVFVTVSFRVFSSDAWFCESLQPIKNPVDASARMRDL